MSSVKEITLQYPMLIKNEDMSRKLYIVNQLKGRVDDLKSEIYGRKPDLRSLQAQEQERNNKGQFARKRKDSDGNN